MFCSYFWKATAERAVKAFAQSLLAILGAGSIGLLAVDWPTSLSTAGLAALLSVLSSVASSRIGSPSDPSALPGPRPAPEPSVAQAA